MFLRTDCSKALPFPSSLSGEAGKYKKELFMESEDKSSVIDEKICHILSSYPSIKLAILFGSLASGKAKFESDLDLAVLSKQPLTQDEKMQLISILAQNFMRPIDLIDLHTVGEPLLGQILANGQRIIGSDTCYGHLITRHLYAEADFMPYQRRILKERREKWIGI